MWPIAVLTAVPGLVVCLLCCIPGAPSPALGETPALGADTATLWEFPVLPRALQVPWQGTQHSSPRGVTAVVCWCHH